VSEFSFLFGHGFTAMNLRIPAAVSIGLAMALFTVPAIAAEGVVVEMHLISPAGVGKAIGKVTLSDTANGFLALKFAMAVEIPAGGHGMHIHENPSCDPAEKDGAMVAGLAAGGHYDPKGTGKHMGPSGDGHLGDLPILFVDVHETGTDSIRHTLVAPRLKLADVRGRSLVIHAGSDNFRDDPKPLGGGGTRIACGVIPAGGG
jgi:Cu-Zn family superoxide dismutase